jgi:hypothetical protein
MNIHYITGYAGTGKSTELLELITTLDPESSVVLAPTHKALNRLRSATDSDVELKTIHSLLGWIPGINEDAKHVNHVDVIIRLARPIEQYTTIVIDEGGMMSEDMLTSIISRLEDVNDYETDHITLHIFLDPYQLLPVKGKQIQTDPLFTKNLTTQHRSESPDVVNLFTKFVNYLEGTNKVDLSTPESSNVILTDNVKDFRKGDRLLAYTNNAVGFYNKLIAQQFGITSYEGQTVQLGNIADTFLVQDIVEPSIGQLLNYYESGKLVLQNSQINKLYLQENLQALLDNENITFIKAVNKIIPVVEGVGNANIVRQNAKLAAVDNKRNFKEVYALGRAFTMDYTFASTIHKAQGSEFNRVWIDKADVQKSIFGGSYMNYARLMYVAISRARQTIFILG